MKRKEIQTSLNTFFTKKSKVEDSAPVAPVPAPAPASSNELANCCANNPSSIGDVNPIIPEPAPVTSPVPDTNNTNPVTATSTCILSIGHSTTGEASDINNSLKVDVNVGGVSDSTERYYDISETVGKKISDLHRESYLRRAWLPPNNFKFPVRYEYNKNLSFQRTWLDQFEWLVYSRKEDGAYCKYCALFASESEGKGKHQELGYFVTKGFKKWKKAKESFRHHATLKYHINSITLAHNFLAIYDGRQKDIQEKIRSDIAKQREDNKAKLLSIVKTIILCGRQELALRGTNDSGNVLAEKDCNDGTFRALLRFRVEAGDKTLESHLLFGQKNAQYTSSVVQNQIINICGNVIKDKIAERVNRAGAFSVLCDETTDISRIEQMSLCVRYIDPDQIGIREDFIEFTPISDMSGNGIASTILTRLGEIGINTNNLIGQGYDGASAMSGNFNGVQAVIRRQYPLALYVHCSAHSLNLAIADTCKVRDLSNCLGTIQAVGNFFRSSALRTDILTDAIKNSLPENRHKNLVAMCETRWVQKHDSVIRFDELLVPITDALEKLNLSGNRETSQAAHQLLASIQCDGFLTTLKIASKIFAITINLCKFLQGVDCDLSIACEHVDDVVTTLNNIRHEADDNFSKIFKEASASAKLLNGADYEISMPRRVGRQTNRNNVEADTPEQYYKRASFLPIIDHVISHLTERFTNHKTTISSLAKLMPTKCVNCRPEDFEEIICFYETVLPADRCNFYGEYLVWRNKWLKVGIDERPSSAIKALESCDGVLFPIINKLLRILLTLPVSTCTPERTFSSLRRLKNYLRNTMSTERLTGMALLSIHRDVEVDPKEVVDIFSHSNRRIAL